LLSCKFAENSVKSMKLLITCILKFSSFGGVRGDCYVR
jgi:hypothetical protein